jgi:hypothetical protein
MVACAARNCSRRAPPRSWRWSAGGVTAASACVRCALSKVSSAEKHLTGGDGLSFLG